MRNTRTRYQYIYIPMMLLGGCIESHARSGRQTILITFKVNQACNLPEEKENRTVSDRLIDRKREKEREKEINRGEDRKREVGNTMVKQAERKREREKKNTKKT